MIYIVIAIKMPSIRVKIREIRDHFCRPIEDLDLEYVSIEKNKDFGSFGEVFFET